MAPHGPALRPPFEQLSRQQLELYARDLQKRLQEERHLRLELEQRVRESAALNRLFQEHLDQRFAVIVAYCELLARLQGPVQGASLRQEE